MNWDFLLTSPGHVQCSGSRISLPLVADTAPELIDSYHIEFHLNSDAHWLDSYLFSASIWLDNSTTSAFSYFSWGHRFHFTSLPSNSVSPLSQFHYCIWTLNDYYLQECLVLKSEHHLFMHSAFKKHDIGAEILPFQGSVLSCNWLMLSLILNTSITSKCYSAILFHMFKTALLLFSSVKMMNYLLLDNFVLWIACQYIFGSWFTSVFSFVDRLQLLLLWLQAHPYLYGCQCLINLMAEAISCSYYSVSGYFYWLRLLSLLPPSLVIYWFEY